MKELKDGNGEAERNGMGSLFQSNGGFCRVIDGMGKKQKGNERESSNNSKLNG